MPPGSDDRRRAVGLDQKGGTSPQSNSNIAAQPHGERMRGRKGDDEQENEPKDAEAKLPQNRARPSAAAAAATATTPRATTTFDDAIATAPLTPLGRVLSALPVDPSVGKMLALGALLGEIEHVLTLAAALSTQTPFDARAAGSASGANPVAEFASPNGKNDDKGGRGGGNSM